MKHFYILQMKDINKNSKMKVISRTERGMKNSIYNLLFASLILSGCASSQAKMDDGDNTLLQIPQDTQALAPADSVQSVDFQDINLSDRERLHVLTDRAEIEKDTDNYVRTGQADVISRPDGTFLFPYGLAQVTLRTKKMMYSKIILQEGEKITSAAAADTVRWEVQPSYIGDANDYTPVVLIKPFFGGLQTNVSIITNKRDYDIYVRSVDTGDFMERIGYYYPQDKADIVNTGMSIFKDADAQATAPKINVENIQHNYKVDGDKRLPWYPLAVFDDSQKVYIKMPPKVSRSELPAFMAVDEAGQINVVNYRYFRPYFIVDTIFENGLLVLGTDKYRKIIKIKRTAR
jgi:type IV secretion system protein TrbG